MIKTLKLVNSWSQLHSHSTTETHLEANENPEDEIQLKMLLGVHIQSFPAHKEQYGDSFKN